MQISRLSLKGYLKRIPLLVKFMRRWKESPLNMPLHLWHTRRYLREIRELTLSHHAYLIQRNHPNPLNRFGKKCFSQADEDGITIEILRRVGSIDHGIFAEFGVDDGTENNTLILKALGWKGFWVGGGELRFKINSRREDFVYLRDWITLENITQLTRKGMQCINASNIDVISLDLDGNDLYFIKRLLSDGFTPKLFIVEYNAKFPPPIKWEIAYDEHHTWKEDDYFGASLASFMSLFERFNFRLVCCNSHTGSNAFFIRRDFESAFDDVPRNIEELYVSPRYYRYECHGHRPSIRTISKLFE
jgi:hypothetical protein